MIWFVGCPCTSKECHGTSIHGTPLSVQRPALVFTPPRISISRSPPRLQRSARDQKGIWTVKLQVCLCFPSYTTPCVAHSHSCQIGNHCNGCPTSQFDGVHQHPPTPQVKPLTYDPKTGMENLCHVDGKRPSHVGVKIWVPPKWWCSLNTNPKKAPSTKGTPRIAAQPF